MNYFICYTNSAGHNEWEIVSGHDGMQIRVCEIMKDNNISDARDVKVFPDSAEIV